MLKVEYAIRDGQGELRFSGALDENAVIPAFSDLNFQRIGFNFTHLSTVNSAGIRTWIEWIKSIPKNPTYVFSKCPVHLVNCIGAVQGMLPPRSELDSFFVPYVGVSTLEKIQIEYKQGVHFSAKELMIPSRVSSEETGQELEIDAVPKRYFRFLEKFFPNILIG